MRRFFPAQVQILVARNGDEDGVSFFNIDPWPDGDQLISTTWPLKCCCVLKRETNKQSRMCVRFSVRSVDENGSHPDWPYAQPDGQPASLCDFKSYNDMTLHLIIAPGAKNKRLYTHVMRTESGPQRLVSS